MNKQQRDANIAFFNSMISMTKEGGTYIWPDENAVFTIKNGKMIGALNDCRKVLKITSKAFAKSVLRKKKA